MNNARDVAQLKPLMEGKNLHAEGNLKVVSLVEIFAKIPLCAALQPPSKCCKQNGGMEESGVNGDEEEGLCVGGL